MPCNLVVDNVNGSGSGGPNVNDGIRFNSMNGGIIRNSNVSGFLQGIFVDAYSRDVIVEDNTSSYNRSHGIAVYDGPNPPDNITVRRNKTFGNGTDTTSAGIYINTSTNCKVYENITGIKGMYDPTQRYGIWAEGGVSGLEGWDNYHHSATETTGIGEVLFSGSEFNKLRKWRIGVTDPSYVPTNYAGVTVVPYDYVVGTDGITRGVYKANRAGLSGDVNPSGGNWVKGEIIEYNEPLAGGFEACVCTTSGVGNSTAVFKTIRPVSS